MSGILPYILIIILIALSAFFSASEIALTSFNKLRMQKSAEEGNKAAKLVCNLNDRFDETLSVILVGNNIVNMTASSVATVIAISVLGNGGVAVATAVLTVAILIFGEIIPKIIATQKSETLVKLVAYPMLVIKIILFPLIFVIMKILSLVSKLWQKKDDEDEATVTEDELVTIIETIEEEGVIDEEKSELLRSAIEFNDSDVYDVITPRIDMTAVDIEDSFEQIKKVCDESHYSRLPVYEDTIDNIIGILNLDAFYRNVLQGKTDVRAMLSVPTFIHRTMKLPAALSMMKKNHIHIAMVIDEFGGVDGLVTMEDIIEEIVGDIWDENDEIVSEYEKIDDDTYTVNSEMNLYDLFELTETDDKDIETDCTTVGGWVTEILESTPHLDDRFDFRNLHITVTEMEDNLRVLKVRVEIEREADAEVSENEDELQMSPKDRDNGEK